MYRLFGVLFIIASMTWTWSVVHSYSPLDTEAHAAIQNQLLNYLQQKIIDKNPDATNLAFPKLWTETITENKIQASFEITYTNKGDPSSINRVKGDLVLYREPTSKKKEVEWRVIEPKITDQSMEFGEGIIITPNGIIEPNAPTNLTEPPAEDDAAPAGSPAGSPTGAPAAPEPEGSKPKVETPMSPTSTPPQGQSPPADL